MRPRTICGIVDTLMWSSEELIVAPATVPGCGARAVVRFAGDGLADLLPAICTAADWPRHGDAPRVVRATLAATTAATRGPDAGSHGAPRKEEAPRAAVAAAA